ncbi:MAG: hypothetical protein ABUL55_02195 [Pseudomonadota bacterium]
MRLSVAKTAFVAALFAASFTGSAFAQDKTVTVHLSTPLAAPTRIIAQNTIWNCSGDTCVALSHRDPTAHECHVFVREARQAVTAYGTADQQLSSDELAHCNGDVGQSQQARN